MYDDGELVEQCRSGDRSAPSSGDQVIDDIVNLRAVVEHEAQNELVGRKSSKGQAERVDLSSKATIDGVVSEQSSIDEPATYHLADLAAATGEETVSGHRVSGSATEVWRERFVAIAALPRNGDVSHRTLELSASTSLSHWHRSASGT